MKQIQLPFPEWLQGRVRHVEDVLDDEQETYWLVGAGDENYDEGKILVTSPIGKGLIGKKVGEIAEFEVPRGTCKLRVVKIEYELD